MPTLRPFALIALPLLLAGCNMDIVLPVEDEVSDVQTVTVVDLNGRTQNVAVVNGVPQLPE